MRTNDHRALALAMAATLGAAPAAEAATIFDNPDNRTGYSHFFSTAGGAALALDGFAAQRFVLSAPTRLTDASFTAVYLDRGSDATAVNWLLLAADGSGGSPGTLLAAGTSAIASKTLISSSFGQDIVRHGFALASAPLAIGGYVIAVQAVAARNNIGIGGAAAPLPTAFLTIDGGSSWRPNHNSNAWAMSLSGAPSGPPSVVPEPASWALLIAGFGLTGAAMRQRRHALA